MSCLTNKEQYFLDCSKKVLAAELSGIECVDNYKANACISDSIRIANRMTELIFNEKDSVRQFSDIEKLLKDTPIDFDIL